jgi:hypothetical protein
LFGVKIKIWYNKFTNKLFFNLFLSLLFMSQNNNSSSNLEPNLWSDSLLVKDENGQIHPWHEATVSPGTSLMLAPVFQPAKVPLNDHFLASPKVGSAKSPATHAFHPDDEEDVKSLVESLPLMIVKI